MQYSRKNMYIMAISFEMVIEGYKITGLTVEPKDKTVVHSVPSAGNCGPTCTEGRVRHSTLYSNLESQINILDKSCSRWNENPLVPP